MNLDTAILMLREFSARKLNCEVVCPRHSDCIVKVRELGIHLPTSLARQEAEEIAFRLHKNADLEVGANVVMFV